MNGIPSEFSESLLNNHVEPHEVRQILACRPLVAVGHPDIFQRRDRPVGLQEFNRQFLPFVQQVGLIE